MIVHIMALVFLVVSVLAFAAVPVCLGAILRLLFRKMHRNLPTLLAAAILFFLQEKLLPGALDRMLSITMSATPEDNAARPMSMAIILVVYPFAGLAIPFILAWIGASLVDRIRNKRNPNQASDATSEPAPSAASSSHQG